PTRADQTVGLFLNTDQSQQGYTLLAPGPSTVTHLLDPNGRPVKTWTSAYNAGLAAYLTEAGHLIRAGTTTPDAHFVPNAGGGGRWWEESAGDGSIVWTYDYTPSLHLSHHDLKKLPNGNVIFVAWDYKTQAEAIAAGRNPNLVPSQGAWGESLIEVQPIPPSSG